MTTKELINIEIDKLDEMQKWEYKTILRGRGFLGKNENDLVHWADDWNVDIEEIEKLGEEGWELVAISPRSAFLGGFFGGSSTSADYAGFTNEELWVFKRPKP